MYSHIIDIFKFWPLLLMLTACGGEPTITPKPRAYPRVIFPEKEYQQFRDEADCPMTFMYPTYARIERDERFFDQKAPSDCWFDIVYPQFNGRVHCTYYPLSGEQQYQKLRDDVFDLAYKHSRKASFIEENPIENQYGTSGFSFEIRGHAASPLQFFVSDSTNHFLRGAFYISAQVNPDSLAPVQEFIKADIFKMMETFKWVSD